MLPADCLAVMSASFCAGQASGLISRTEKACKPDARRDSADSFELKLAGLFAVQPGTTLIHQPMPQIIVAKCLTPK
jgi:hypothetical protein